MTVRINLLPPEIRERRKYERFYPWVFIGAAVVLGLILLVGVGLMFQVANLNRDLQSAQENAQLITKQAEAFKVFETKEAELQQRRQIVEQALSGRVNWGKVANEVSLVLPSEVWLSVFSGEQDVKDGPFDPKTGELVAMPATLKLTGYTPDDQSKSTIAEGYKSLAKTLVRLNDLSSLYGVWLENAELNSYPAQVSEGYEPTDVLNFNITSNVVVTVDATATTAPAPPTTTGQ